MGKERIKQAHRGFHSPQQQPRPKVITNKKQIPIENGPKLSNQLLEHRTQHK